MLIFYSASAKLNFLYLDIKNKYSDDNKYLAVVTKNGLWIKDEIKEEGLDEPKFLINTMDVYKKQFTFPQIANNDYAVE